MSEPAINPGLALRLDFDHGRVTLRGRGRYLVVPQEALLELLQAAGTEALHNFGQQLGVEIGRRLVDSPGSRADTASVEAFVEQLGAELALLGLGALAVERWGRALVIAIEGAPTGAPSAQLIAAVVTGALQRALSRDTAAVELMRGDDTLRLLIVSKGVAAEVTQWLAEQIPWGTVLTRLHVGRGEAS